MTDSRIIKRSVSIAGHASSVSLEKPFWDALKQIAESRKMSLNALITEIDGNNPQNLSSALRCYVLEWTIQNNAVSFRT